MREAYDIDHIKKLVDEGIEQLPDKEKAWAKEHRIQPREHHCVGATSEKPMVVVLVTDDIGESDGSYRVAYNPDTKCFCMEVIELNGTSLYLGDCGSFYETVINL